MYKLKLTFGALLKHARQFKRWGFTKMERRCYLAGFLNGAENWELPERKEVMPTEKDILLNAS